MIIKKTFTILFLLFFFSNSFAAKITVEITEEAKQKNAELKYKKVIDEKTDEIRKLLKRGEILIQDLNSTEALTAYENALEIAKEYNLIDLELESLISIANLKHSQNKGSSAIKFFQEALEISKNLPKQDKIGYIYTRLGYLYFDNDIKLSKIYLEQAVDINTKKENNELLAENYFNLITVNKKLGLLEEAKKSENKYRLYKKFIKEDKIYKLSRQAENNEFRLYISPPEGSNLTDAEYTSIQILNKITGFTYQFQLRLGNRLSFKNIEITPKACFKSAPQDLPENMLLVEVSEIEKVAIDTEKQKIIDTQNENITKIEKAGNSEHRIVGTNRKNIFNGWLFSSSSSLNSLKHSIYDLKVLDCQQKTI